MTTTTPTNPGWRIQLAVHRAVRRDTARLASALTTGDAPAEAVRAYWATTATQLHHHHEFEDSVIWPLLGERLGGRIEALLIRNAGEHEVMAASMGDFDAVLTAADTTAALAALGRMRQAIETHLAAEETDVLPLIPQAFTADDIAYFQSESAKTNTASEFLPWMLDDASDEDVAYFTAAMPAPVLAQLESDWTPKRRLAVDALHLNGSVAAAAS